MALDHMKMTDKRKKEGAQKPKSGANRSRNWRYSRQKINSDMRAKIRQKGEERNVTAVTYKGAALQACIKRNETTPQGSRNKKPRENSSEDCVKRKAGGSQPRA
jgi:hypothetical protein